MAVRPGASVGTARRSPCPASVERIGRGDGLQGRHHVGDGDGETAGQSMGKILVKPAGEARAQGEQDDLVEGLADEGVLHSVQDLGVADLAGRLDADLAQAGDTLAETHPSEHVGFSLRPHTR